MIKLEVYFTDGSMSVTEVEEYDKEKIKEEMNDRSSAMIIGDIVVTPSGIRRVLPAKEEN